MKPEPKQPSGSVSEVEHGFLVDSTLGCLYHSVVARKGTEPLALIKCASESEYSWVHPGRIALRIGEMRRGSDVGFLGTHEAPITAWARNVLQGIMAKPLVEQLAARLVDTPQENVVAARIELLEHKVEELASELKSRPVVSSATLLDLGEEGIVLRQPIQVVIERYEEEVTASWPEVEAFGSGDSVSEAILALKRDIVTLHKDLQSTPDNELGALSLGWKRTLQMVVAERGIAERQTA